MVDFIGEELTLVSLERDYRGFPTQIRSSYLLDSLWLDVLIATKRRPGSDVQAFPTKFLFFHQFFPIEHKLLSSSSVMQYT